MLPNFNPMDMNQFGMMNNQSMPSQNLLEDNINYYQEACKLYIANVVLTTQMKELVAEKNELLAKITKLEKKVNENLSNSFQNAEDKKKRHRRVATEIDRHYRCPIESCQKSYGSEGSLTQHIKLKHPDYFSKMGLSHFNLKSLDDSKSLEDSEINNQTYNNFQNNNTDEINKNNSKNDDKSSVSDKEIANKSENNKENAKETEKEKNQVYDKEQSQKILLSNELNEKNEPEISK